MRSATEIITDIDDTVRQLDLGDKEGISVAAVELAQYNVGLGNWLADALEAERVLERDLKLKRAQLMIAKRKRELTVGESEAQSLIETKDLQDELLEVQKATTLYKIKRNDVEKMIDTIRSRLAVIRSDMDNTSGEGGL